MKRLAVLVLLLMLAACQSDRVETRTDRISYTVEEITVQESDNLLVGQEKSIQEAVPGIKDIVKEVTYRGDEVVAEKIISETVIEEARPAIIARGTKEVKQRAETVSDKTIKTIRQPDSELEEGQEIVLQDGRAGQTRRIIEDTYVKGKLVDSKVIEREVVAEAVPQIIAYGTKEASQPAPDPVTPPPEEPSPPPVTAPGDYSGISNADLSWWYQPGPPSTISGDVAAILAGHQVYWQLNPASPTVYLTFDEGYEYGDNTAQILATLKEKGVKATFFLTGSYVDNNPGLVQQMINDGHQLGNHTVHHYRASNALNEGDQVFISDVVDLNAKVPAMTKLHRPPEGGYSERSLRILDDLGYTAVFWSFAYRDWLTDNQPDPEEAKQVILSQLHNGSIILLHAVSNTNVAILGEVIDGIIERGYAIELLPTN